MSHVIKLADLLKAGAPAAQKIGSKGVFGVVGPTSKNDTNPVTITDMRPPKDNSKSVKNFNPPVGIKN